MRLLLIALLAVALAAPAAAVADRRTDDRAGKSHQQKAAMRKKQKQLRARAVARARRMAIARSAGATVVPSGRLELRGALTSLSPLTVGTLSCTLPSGVTLTGLAVGDFVELDCTLVGTQWVLRRIHREDDLSSAGGADEREVKGALTSLAPLTVGSLSCAVPAGVTLAGFAVGDFVELECKLVAGTWTLHKLELEGDHTTLSGTDPHADGDTRAR
jgi:hypothetical protein